MPELPEVSTTVNILKKILPGLTITSVWSDYNSRHFAGKQNIKDKKYFLYFSEQILGKKICDVSRVGKNILLSLSSSKTILIHMKMTGHLLYGIYTQTNGTWVAREPGPLQDPFNRHVRLVFSLSNKHHLALSDARRFAKVTLVETFPAATHNDLQILGPDPTDKKFSLANFRSALLKKPRGKIKTVLMDQTILAGIGNIYSDEALWLSGLHPEKIVGTLSLQDTKSLFKSLRTVLKLGIDFGGDSTSDYRRPDGSPGTFQHRHNVYQRRGERCKKRGCNGVITRIVVNGRSAHFCSQHQRK